MTPRKKKHTTQKPVRLTSFANQLTGFYILRLTKKHFQAAINTFLRPFKDISDHRTAINLHHRLRSRDFYVQFFSFAKCH